VNQHGNDLANDLAKELAALLDGESDAIANAANTAALLNLRLERINWVGFYFLRERQLVVGPYQGRPACVRIEAGRGVCGSAVQQNATLVVPDVHEFPGHIACDPASRSELVVPLRRAGRVAGVLDVDSPELDRFRDADASSLEQVAAIYEQSIDWDTLPK